MYACARMHVHMLLAHLPLPQILPKPARQKAEELKGMDMHMRMPPAAPADPAQACKAEGRGAQGHGVL